MQNNEHRINLQPMKEENTVCFLVKFAQGSLPLTQLQRREAIKNIVGRMSLARRLALPFKSHGPPQYNIRTFCKRHSSSLLFVSRFDKMLNDFLQ